MVQVHPGGIALSDSHHVARHCRRRHLRSDGQCSEPCRPLRDAFELRPGEELTSQPTGWSIFTIRIGQAQIAGVQQALTDKGFRVRRNAAFAVLSVVSATTACKNDLNLDIQIATLGEGARPIPHRHLRLHYG